MLKVDCGYLTALGKSPASAGSRSSSSRSRSCSSNSLKSGYDAGEWPPTTPNIRKGKQNSTLHNYCPFINCKFYVRGKALFIPNVTQKNWLLSVYFLVYIILYN